MQVTRRSALVAGGLAAAAALLPSTPSWAALTSAGRAGFEASVGRTVVLRTPSGRVRAVVSGVRDIIGFPAGSPAGYSVLFTPTARVPDGIYRIVGDRLGSATLFLANVGQARTRSLEAVVSTSAS